MNICRNLTDIRAGHVVLFCSFVAIAIYGMATGNLILGLLLVAGGCLLHAVDKVERVSTPHDVLTVVKER